jgi:hypothetical protein
MILIPEMVKSSRLLFLILTLLPMGAPAQLFQNSDLYYMAGPLFTRTEAIGNSGVTLYGSTGFAWTWGFGHQIKRVEGATLWLDIPMTFIVPSHETASIPGSISLSGLMLVPDARLMLPLSSRVSAFVDAGGGGGFFAYPVIQSTSPALTDNDINHGVLSFGGGLDFRLSQHWSLRLDARDYVTGRDLSGIPGRNHPIAMFGIVMH